jgi:hypothetical protein
MDNLEEMMDDIVSKLNQDVHCIFRDWQEKLNITDGTADPYDSVNLDYRIRELAEQIVHIIKEMPRQENPEYEEGRCYEPRS